MNRRINKSVAILMILMMVFTWLPCIVYAAEDNSGTLENFPSLGFDGDKDVMQNNNGTITKVSSKGEIVNNNNTIITCSGTVNVNQAGASIDALEGGTAYVGTNSGTISKMSNDAIVNSNDGKIEEIGNSAKVTNNYGAITKNAGEIEHMYKGTVKTNEESGKIAFTKEGNLVIGTCEIETNKGQVTVNVDQKATYEIVITNNEKELVLTAGKVSLENNTGKVTVSGSAELLCNSNDGTIILNDNAKVSCTTNNKDIKANSASAKCDCTNNNGTIISGNYYEVIIRDNDNAPIAEAKAIVGDACVKFDNKKYMVYDNNEKKTLRFTLPEGYHCVDEDAIYNSSDDSWEITCFQMVPAHFIEIPDTNTGHFYINCCQCTYDKFISDENNHWKVCSVCKKYEKKSAHEIVIDSRVEPTETTTGLTEGSHCSVCNKVIKAQEIIPAKGKPSNNKKHDDNNSGTNPSKFNKEEVNSKKTGDEKADGLNESKSKTSLIEKVEAAKVVSNEKQIDKKSLNEEKTRNGFSKRNSVTVDFVQENAEQSFDSNVTDANSQTSDVNDSSIDSNSQTSDVNDSSIDSNSQTSNVNDSSIDSKEDEGTFSTLGVVLATSGVVAAGACATGLLFKFKIIK